MMVTNFIRRLFLCGLVIPADAFTEPSSLAAAHGKVASATSSRCPVAQYAATANPSLTREEDDEGEALPPPSMSRRRAAASSLLLLSAPFLAGRPSLASANDGADGTFFRGTATLQVGVESEAGPGSALYVTARPNRPDNVPRAILDGSRGKPPPVLAGRFADPTFPFDFALTRAELTPEGAATEGSEGDGGGGTPLWWEGEDLVVSARLDSDGVAATRDPTDLVGRGFYSAKGGRGAVSIELQGRGLFGKSVTGKSKK